LDLIKKIQGYKSTRKRKRMSATREDSKKKMNFYWKNKKQKIDFMMVVAILLQILFFTI